MNSYIDIYKRHAKNYCLISINDVMLFILHIHYVSSSFFSNITSS